MATGGLAHLWYKWGIQIMVVASFALQLFLLGFGGIRRRSSSAVLSAALWLAYLLADSTAIYTLGHLAVATESRGHQLVAFWAPFLLLHLGGPDNITAYALEDNRLWLRHLQTLIVQALGAGFVIYKYMSSTGFLLRLAAISMFITGLAKYGERIWALKCGNMSSIRSSIKESPDRDDVDLKELLREGITEEEILLRAHSQFLVCKCVFTDTKLDSGMGDIYAPRTNLDKLVEMELSFMYDILYTKAAVIHTWYGFCIHFISLVTAATALLLFMLGISNRNGYSRVDLIISYALLVGALVLEIVSLCRALLSTWTCWSLNCKGWKQLLKLVGFLRQLVQPARRRLWQGSIGQYNLFQFCTRDRNGLGSRVTMKMGLQDWWNKLHFSGTFSGTESLSIQDLKDRVLQEVEGVRISLNLRGSHALERMGIYEGHANWSIERLDFDESILVWHIATDVYIHKSKNTEHDQKLLEATNKVLSNYMVFLLVVKPEMVPGRTRHNLFADVLRDLEDNTTFRLTGEDNSSLRTWNPYYMVKELLHHEGPSSSRIPLREKLADDLLNEYISEDGDVRKMVVRHGVLLGKELLDRKLRAERDTLEVILGVWVEMMVYAAEHCSRDSHARQLSHGGEFITTVWLVVHHLKFYLTPSVANDAPWETGFGAFNAIPF
ncbi:unnamed protein product [Urochloa decumbens]|uniref:DUF4220 domain-containing protein n=1 Tax=Urochloa decumbens TaxID=240449 RepID=A0ABC9ATN7_9POAL